MLHADTMPGWRPPGNLSIWLTSPTHHTPKTDSGEDVDRTKAQRRVVAAPAHSTTASRCRPEPTNYMHYRSSLPIAFLQFVSIHS